MEIPAEHFVNHAAGIDLFHHLATTVCRCVKTFVLSRTIFRRVSEPNMGVAILEFIFPSVNSLVDSISLRVCIEPQRSIASYYPLLISYYYCLR